MLPGQYIGDSWYHIANGVIHCFFLTAPETIPIQERWNHWDIGHAVSTDLFHWEYVGLALEKGGAGAWDSQKLATGSVIAWDRRFWMAYTGIVNVDGYWQPRIGIAVSNDLNSWEKLDVNPITEPDGVIYGKGDGVRKPITWRDPFIIRHGGKFLQYFCARPPSSDSAGFVGLASSPDLQHWSLEAPVAVESFASELEVPQIYHINNRYFLLFCTTADRILPEVRTVSPDHRYRSSDYVMVSDSPYGPFRRYGSGDIHPTEREVIPYASQLLHWQGELFLLGTVVRSTRPQREPDYITDPIAITVSDTSVMAN